MGRQKDREAFVAAMTAEGMPLPMIRALMRAATTLHRLEEANCSIEVRKPRHYTAPLGILTSERPRATMCGVALPLSDDYVRSGDRIAYHQPLVTCWACKAALVEKRVERLLAGSGFAPVFGGDPRGAAIRVRVPSGKSDSWAGDGICVP
jgi:hypothetical protein